MQPDILWHLVLGVFFFPVGRFWILQKLGQVGLIDASYTTRSLTCLGFQWWYIQRKSPPSNHHTLGIHVCVCVLNSTMALCFPPKKKPNISPSKKKRIDGWKDDAFSELKKLVVPFFWGGGVPLRSLGEKPPMGKLPPVGFFNSTARKPSPGVGFSIQHDVDESIEPGQWFYPTLCGCTSVWVFNHRKGKPVNRKVPGSPQIEGLNSNQNKGEFVLYRWASAKTSDP